MSLINVVGDNAAEQEPTDGKRKCEAVWPIFRYHKCVSALPNIREPTIMASRIHHQKSRYLYDLFYRRKAISRGELAIKSLQSRVTTVIAAYVLASLAN